MTEHTMPMLTDSDREELIKQANHLMISSPFHAVAQISLAALTAEKYGYVHNVSQLSEGKVFKEENRHYGKCVYTAPPVPALKLPEEADESNLPFAAMSWNACIAEVKRLNGVTE